MRLRGSIINLAIIACLALLSLAVWAGKQTPPDPYLEDVLARGALRVGIDPTYPPFESVRDGTIEGYDVELARAIASDLGVRLEPVPLALDTMYDALAAGRVDLLLSALPFVYERQIDVRYSVPYYQAGQVLLTRRGDGRITSPAGLAGMKVAVELGSNADTEARLLARTSLPTMQVQSTYHSPEEALDALRDATVDAAITDNASAQAYMRAHPDLLATLSPPLTDEPYVVAMPNRAAGLGARVNATIERLRASGELARVMGMAQNQ